MFIFRTLCLAGVRRIFRSITLALYLLALCGMPADGFTMGTSARAVRTVGGSTALQSSESADGFRELSNTLTRLDRQWRLQQRERSTSRWTKIVLANRHEGTEAREYAPEAPVPQNLQDNIVYLLEPPNKSSPSCLITFIGGAGKCGSMVLLIEDRQQHVLSAHLLFKITFVQAWEPFLNSLTMNF